MKQVIIAHQGRIPTYRVPFYTLLEELRPVHWRFYVVDSGCPSADYPFPVMNARLYGRGLPLQWQDLSGAAREADVLVLDTHLRNLGYLAAVHKRRESCRLVFWGHTHNRGDNNGLKRAVKTNWLRRADAFFAYTPRQAEAAVAVGIAPDSIFTLHNTIDIQAERKRYEENVPNRAEIRQQFGFSEDSRVLLLIGRLNKARRVVYLLKAFRFLAGDEKWKLVIVGDGDDLALVRRYQNDYMKGQLQVMGECTDPDFLSRLQVAADAFVMPGAVGLAPLSAICHELPVFALEGQGHGPEFDYLTPDNSVISPAATLPEDFAGLVKSWLESGQKPGNPYDSIRHLTLDAMVRNFIDGINQVVQSGGRVSLAPHLVKSQIKP